MILTHGANSISRVPEILYLTYFNNFNLSTKVDTPIIGNPTQYQTEYTFATDTISCMGGSIPAMSVTSNLATDRHLSSKINTDNIKSLSIEWFYYVPNKYASQGISCNVNPAYGFGLDVFGWGGGNGFVTSWRASNISSYNGAQVNSNYVVVPLRFYDNVRHLAIIVNQESHELKFFVDGLIYTKFSLNQTPAIYPAYLCPKNGWLGKITQVAIFGYDKSINDGMNYPVPTSPYYPIA